MIKNLPSFDEAQKAIKRRKDPTAFLHLGIMYAQGIGTTQDETLAQYFLKKALNMGCREAEEYLKLEYESGTKDFGKEIEDFIGDSDDISRELIAKIKVRVEKERMADNIGNLVKIRRYLSLFYPKYNRDKAISDTLNNSHTVDADILFTQSSADNRSEVYIESQDRLLRQLYSQVTSNQQLYETIMKTGKTVLLSKDESELAQCIVNLTSSYNTICRKYGIESLEIYNLDSLVLYPYIKVSDLALLRRQGFRALLSIRNTHPTIERDFLESIESDEKLLNVCERIEDQDLQLFLISFVELRIDIESLEINSLNLLNAYRNNNFVPLVEHINAFVVRLNKAGIKNHLPCYTPELLPPINLSKGF